MSTRPDGDWWNDVGYGSTKTDKSLYRKAHYGMVAGRLKAARTLFRDDAAVTALIWLQTQFVQSFEADNPRFSRDEFNKACEP